MIEFILNNKTVQCNQPSGYLLLDFIRNDKQLKGTKIGCREGDCGACTVLIGTSNNGKMQYVNATSCLTTLGNIHGRHVVTIEGIRMDQLSPVQEMIINHSGTQCGFCTVGFIISLTSACLTYQKNSIEDTIATISGNICRCTGYKSIEAAVQELTDDLSDKNLQNPLEWLITKNYIPKYFETIPKRLETINTLKPIHNAIFVGGGTDLYVQKPDELMSQNINPITQSDKHRYIKYEHNYCTVGAAITVSEFQKNPFIISIFPELDKIFKLISSKAIRNTSTIIGNFVNASPIGDLTAFFLVLNTSLNIVNSSSSRKVKLTEFFLGYKDIDLKKGEMIESLEFLIPKSNSYFNFDKVSKRTHLDIASVNSAIQLTMLNERIEDIHISVGGVGPTPIYLKGVCHFLKGQSINEKVIVKAYELMQDEISPISDIRGSDKYKRLLIRQLFYAHFLKLFSNKISFKTILKDSKSIL